MNPIDLEVAPKVLLTTYHPLSHYGIPVLLMDGVAYGPLDIVPLAMRCSGDGGATAGCWLAGRLSETTETTDEMRRAAEAFLSAWQPE